MNNERKQMLTDNYATYLQQEETYQFPAFSRDDVWELGCDLVESCRGYAGPLAAEIYIGDVLVFERTGAYSAMEGMAVFLSREMPEIHMYSEAEGLVLLRARIDTDLFNTPMA